MSRVTDQCAEFLLFPDNTTLGPSFSINGFGFKDELTAKPSFINKSGNGIGLQFNDAGIQIDLPRVDLPVTLGEIKLNLGGFAGDFTIEGMDIHGNKVFDTIVPAKNRFEDILIKVSGLARLVFKGGNNEAIIATICVSLLI